jgi:AbrB family looped-hinge helix DNA binding protein
MTATIDGAGRVVIPKALRDRAGLSPGTRVDFHFRDGSIEISPAASEPSWEQVGRVRYPVVDEAGLSTAEIRVLIEAGREAGD